MSVDIEVKARESEIEEVNLGTSSYEFVYPKVSPLLSAIEKSQALPDDNARGEAILAAQDRWLMLGFGPKQWEHITSRLASEDDPLDFPHILQMFEQLFGKAAQNRPPTWRGDSSALSPPPLRGAVERNRFTSTSGSSPLGVPATS